MSLNVAFSDVIKNVLNRGTSGENGENGENRASGGGKKRRQKKNDVKKSEAKKPTSKNPTSKNPTSKKGTGQRRKRRGGEDGAEVAVIFDNKQYKCKEVGTMPTLDEVSEEATNGGKDLTNALINDIRKTNDEVAPTNLPDMEVDAGDGTITGGGRNRARTQKGFYKKYLQTFTLDKLKKMAKKYGIKITTKKNGKVVQMKKDSIVSKIANLKYPSRRR